MINKQFTDKGVYFSSLSNGVTVPFDKWVDTDDCIYYFPLSNLIDNGLAEIEGNMCFVPCNGAYALDESDRLLLGYPTSYSMGMRVKTNGMLSDNDLVYKFQLMTFAPGGDILPYNRQGNIVECNGNNYLLSYPQYQLAELIGQFNAIPPSKKNSDVNYRFLYKIKEYARESGCFLDEYLSNENVIIPDKVGIDIDLDGDEVVVLPSVDMKENEKFKKLFDKVKTLRANYPVQNEDGEVNRVVLDEKMVEGLRPLKDRCCRFNKEKEIQDLVEHPTEYFDPEIFNLDEFYSDRVIEIGIYKPKFSPFISAYKSNWIPGAVIEDPINGTTNITIENAPMLQELEDAICKAEEQKKPTVEFENAQITVEDAKYLAKMAKEQLKNPQKQVDVDKLNDKEPKNKTQRQVLIIEENEEELTFSKHKDIRPVENTYVLYKDEYLNPQFSLKDHQIEGVAWLQHLFENNASGCLMADDMGLGKTLQILYLIDWHYRTHPKHNPYLIVAPVSLLENWEREYKRFFAEPRLDVKVLRTSDIPRRFNKQIIEKLQTMDIILTSYETMRNCQLNFCAVDFDIIALDEAQKIKTIGTMVTSAAKALKGKFKIAMTGTPVENSLRDLWCIVDFCVPGLLGNARSFADKYEKPLRDGNTDIDALGNEIHNLMGIYFKRRMKKDVAKDLPIKHEIKEQQQMPNVQFEKYNSEISDFKSGKEVYFLVTLQHLREISEHPYVYDNSFENYSSGELISTSARLVPTMNNLDTIRDMGEKVIIFAERLDTQRLLQKIIWDRYGIAAKVINGSTPVNPGNRNSRQATIDAFQEKDGFNVIIMSPIAAGMGLNVTAANHVIHYSRHWNPAKENQATDRAYRIGQTKDVYVYYPMAVSNQYQSFDVTLDELLKRKSNLASSTIYPTEAANVTTEELMNSMLG